MAWSSARVRVIPLQVAYRQARGVYLASVECELEIEARKAGHTGVRGPP